MIQDFQGPSTPSDGASADLALDAQRLRQRARADAPRLSGVASLAVSMAQGAAGALRV